MPFEQEVAEQLAAEYQVPAENVARVLSSRTDFLSWDALAAEWDNAEHDHEKDINEAMTRPRIYAVTIRATSDPLRVCGEPGPTGATRRRAEQPDSSRTRRGPYALRLRRTATRTLWKKSAIASP